jgi:hypothetical protein
MPHAGALQTFPSTTMTPPFDGQPRPWILRLIQAVASADKIVRRGDIIGGVRDQAAPSVVASPKFHRAHHAQLQTMAAVSPRHADARKIAGTMGARGWNETCKANRRGLAKSEPPITLIEFWNRGAIKECKPVKVCHNIRGFVVPPVNLANSVHPLSPESSAFLRCHPMLLPPLTIYRATPQYRATRLQQSL